MNRQDEALLAEAAQVVDRNLRQGQSLTEGSDARLIYRLANRLREIAPTEEPFAVGYYWVRDKVATAASPFILEKSESGWYSSGSEDSYDLLPASYEVVCPAKFVDPKCRDGAPCGACAACTPVNYSASCEPFCPYCGSVIGHSHKPSCPNVGSTP